MSTWKTWIFLFILSCCWVLSWTVNVNVNVTNDIKQELSILYFFRGTLSPSGTSSISFWKDTTTVMLTYLIVIQMAKTQNTVWWSKDALCGDYETRKMSLEPVFDVGNKNTKSYFWGCSCCETQLKKPIKDSFTGQHLYKTQKSILYKNQCKYTRMT